MNLQTDKGINKRYDIIYCDPPWRYEQKRMQGAAEKHYRTMDIQDICGLSVENIASENSILFIWSTFPMLPEALRVISAWGFTFKTVGFVWLKQNRVAKTWWFGLGFWTRGNAEVCLIATKGRPHRQNKGISQLIISPIEAHSKKPDIVRDKIVDLMGDLPRIELFARNYTEGWDVWGNEINSSIELHANNYGSAGGERV